MTSRRNKQTNKKEQQPKQINETPKQSSAAARNPPPIPTAITSQQTIDNCYLEEKFENQEQLIHNLTKKIRALESKVIVLESRLGISENVNTLLEKKLDDLEAYYRRSCIIMSGIERKRNETDTEIKDAVIENLKRSGITKEELESNIDKLHRTGRIDHETNTQPVIIKFNNHSFKEKVYKKKGEIKTRSIRISPSMTKRRMEVLGEVNSFIE